MIGIEEFEPIFGKANVDWDSRSSTTTTTSSSSSFLSDCLFHVHALDASHLRIHATDFRSYTWESIQSIHQLEDLRDDIGVGGSWSEFIDYLVASLKSDDVKLVVKGETSTKSSGATSAKLIARRSKGMPLISISLDRLMNLMANDAMANLSFELFKVFQTQQEVFSQPPKHISAPKNLSAVQEKHGTIHDQVDATLLSKKQKLQKVHMADTTLTYANPSSNLNTSCSTTHESPEKLSTKGPLPRKVGVRAAPPNRRAKVRGAVLQDIDEEESKSKEKDESIQNQLDATLVSEKQNPLTVGMTDETLPDVNRPTNLNISAGSNSYASPEKPSTQGPLSRKVGSRAAPVNRRAKGRGVVLQDTEDDESK